MNYQIHNLKYLKEIRQNLRNKVTNAEDLLWTYLKGKQLLGRKFRRQHSIENYIVDFYCPEERLVIELDGEYHYTQEGQIQDKHRDQRLEELRFRIIRFENKDVFEKIELVLKSIQNAFHHRLTPSSNEEGGEECGDSPLLI